MKRRPSLKDVARRAGVSYQTVSKVLNGQLRVSPDTQARIYRAIEEMDYYPNSLARRLRHARSHTIGFVILPPPQGVSDPFFNELVAAMIEAAVQHHYDVLISVCTSLEEEISALAKLVWSGRIDGVILDSTRMADPRVRFLLERQIPFVTFGRTILDQPYPFVDVNGYKAIHLLTRHLLERGHQRVAFIGPSSEYFYVQDRLKGYLTALREKGLEPLPEWICLGYEREEGGYQAMETLLTLPDPPTAVVAATDRIAIGVMRRAHAAGRVVGRDLAVTGFDDLPLSAFLHPPLTTARQPIQEIGVALVEMLIAQIEAGRILPEGRLLEAEVVFRESA
jgi:LacI family transcriptional regulator